MYDRINIDKIGDNMEFTIVYWIMVLIEIICLIKIIKWSKKKKKTKKEKTLIIIAILLFITLAYRTISLIFEVGNNCCYCIQDIDKNESYSCCNCFIPGKRMK